jgi:hypothetical protein
MNIPPSEFLREFHLGHADIGVGTSTSYSLVFTKAGGMFVRAVTKYDDLSKSAAVHEFRSADFPLLSINGRPMADVVSEKLEDILPRGRIAPFTSGRYYSQVSTFTGNGFPALANLRRERKKLKKEAEKNARAFRRACALAQSRCEEA